METDTLHLTTDILHQHRRPVVVIVRGTTGNTIESVLSLVPEIGVVFAIFVRIILRCHITATAPSLVTDTEILHMPSLVTAVLAAKTSHRRIAVTGHILHPLSHLLYCAATYVTTDIGFAVEHLAEVQELMGTEGVILDSSAPVVVTQRRTLVFGTNTVHPVIVVSKAAARPAHHGNLQCLQCLKDILTVAFDVGDRGVLTNPETSVDT